MGDAPLTETIVDNYIAGQICKPVTNKYLPILNPSTSSQIGQVALSTSQDVNTAVAAAHSAFDSWSSLTVKARAAYMLKFHALVREHANELATLIVLENGKNITEALADVAKGNETVEYACSLPQLMQGKIDRVSGQVTCQDRRDALGVVASIVPFNFPFMVPMWTLPIALVTGNCIVLKPSEKVPLTMYKVIELFEKAGFPKGVINLVNGTKDCVEALIDHPQVKAVTFVGSSPVAKIVSDRCHSLNKRCTALGGAKNHLIALPDCDVEGAASDVVVSYAGCAGQRCMAASVLLIVGDMEDGAQKALLDKVVQKASSIKAGTSPGQMGPVIDSQSMAKILSYIEQSESDGAKILLDGRTWIEQMDGNKGNFIGPTVILHSNKTDKAMSEEIFGPVLSVYNVATWQEAIEIENANPFGNAAAIYTTNGGHAEWFLKRVRASMLGVNIGIPVPREPFSFGGLYGTRSKYGDMDITGDGAIEFFTNRIKITSKWPTPSVPEYAMGTKEGAVTMNGGTDHANFAGRM
jgi:malonate-semialdehyde dehydrogenase (acetylating)/methylmalonate-semialdehyde dehydrogenase